MGACATNPTSLALLDEDVNSNDDLIRKIENYTRGLKETPKSMPLTLLNLPLFFVRCRLEVE